MTRNKSIILFQYICWSYLILMHMFMIMFTEETYFNNQAESELDWKRTCQDYVIFIFILLMLLTVVTLKFDQGHQNRNASVKLNGGYHHAKLERSHVQWRYTSWKRLRGCLLGVYVACIIAWQGGVIIGDSGLCCCVPVVRVAPMFERY